jgi:hypothetical protein
MNKTITLIFRAIPLTLAAMSFSYSLYVYAAAQQLERLHRWERNS